MLAPKKKTNTIQNGARVTLKPHYTVSSRKFIPYKLGTTGENEVHKKLKQSLSLPYKITNQTAEGLGCTGRTSK